MQNKIFGFLIIFVIIFVISCGQSPEVNNSNTQSKASSNNKTSDKMAPDFEFKTLDGKTYKISDFKGKVVILDFWATWCPPCRAEIPHFVKLYNKYKNDGLVIIGCSLDRSIDPVIPFAKENNMSFHVTLGNKKLSELYGGITGIPTTFIINKNGEIVKKIVGGNSEEFFESLIKPLL